MENKDLKVVMIAGCLSLAMVLSACILGKSISEGLQYQGGYISSAGNQVGGSIAQVAGNMRSIQTDSDSDIMDTSQAAQFLKMDVNQLYPLIENSKTVDGKGIPYFKIGNKVLFSKAALSKWVVTSAENRYEY